MKCIACVSSECWPPGGDVPTAWAPYKSRRGKSRSLSACSVFCPSGCRVGLQTELPPACEKGTSSQSKLWGSKSVWSACTIVLFHAGLQKSGRHKKNKKKQQKNKKPIQRQRFGAVVAEQRLLCAYKTGLQSNLHSGGAIITRNIRFYIFSACFNSGEAALPREEDGLA